MDHLKYQWLDITSRVSISINQKKKHSWIHFDYSTLLMTIFTRNVSCLSNCFCHFLGIPALRPFSKDRWSTFPFLFSWLRCLFFLAFSFSDKWVLLLPKRWFFSAIEPKQNQRFEEKGSNFWRKKRRGRSRVAETEGRNCRSSVNWGWVMCRNVKKAVQQTGNIAHRNCH